MSIRNITEENKTCMFDSATGMSFGPVFDTVEMCESFAAWCVHKYGYVYKAYTTHEWQRALELWSDEGGMSWDDGDLSDTARFGAGA